MSSPDSWPGSSPDFDQPEPELEYPQTPVLLETEAHLSGAYHRIVRVTIGLSVAAVGLGLMLNWRTSLGVGIGAALGLVNFIWLRSSTGKLVDRMLVENKNPSLLGPLPETSGNKAESKPGVNKSRFRFIFPFPLRYLLVIGVAYVIVKSYPQLLVGFLVGLLLPLLASTVEGIYEAMTIGKTHQTSD